MARDGTGQARMLLIAAYLLYYAEYIQFIAACQSIRVIFPG